MINLVIYGGSGSGKGTQAKMICEGLGLYHINTGNVLREVDKNSELGKEISSYIDDGHLVPDHLVTKLIKNKYNEILNTNNSIKGFLFDGYPRSIQQARSLNLILSANKEYINNCFHLEIDNDTIIDRLKKRAEIENRIDDQDDNKIQNRINHYNEEKDEILDYYTNQMKLVDIDGNDDKLIILQNILNNITK